MQKVCPFDINAFTGYCKVTSSLFDTYMTNTTLRLITSEVVEGEENTIVLHGLYFDGYDTKLKFNWKSTSAAALPNCSTPHMATAS